jgi:hypothetical protein
METLTLNVMTLVLRKYLRRCGLSDDELYNCICLNGNKGVLRIPLGDIEAKDAKELQFVGFKKNTGEQRSHSTVFPCISLFNNEQKKILSERIISIPMMMNTLSLYLLSEKHVENEILTNNFSDCISDFLNIPDEIILFEDKKKGFVDIVCDWVSPLDVNGNEALLFRISKADIRGKYIVLIKWQLHGYASERTSISDALTGLKKFISVDYINNMVGHIQGTDVIFMKDSDYLNKILSEIKFLCYCMGAMIAFHLNLEETINVLVEKANETRSWLEEYHGYEDISNENEMNMILKNRLLNMFKTNQVPDSLNSRIFLCNIKKDMDIVFDCIAFQQIGHGSCTPFETKLSIEIVRSTSAILIEISQTRNSNSNWIYSELRYQFRKIIELIYRQLS